MGDREGAPAECQPLAGERRREEQAEDEAAAAGARAEDQGVMDAVGDPQLLAVMLFLMLAGWLGRHLDPCTC